MGSPHKTNRRTVVQAKNHMEKEPYNRQVKWPACLRHRLWSIRCRAARWLEISSTYRQAKGRPRVPPGIGKTVHEDRGCLHVPQDTRQTSCTSRHWKDRPSAGIGKTVHEDRGCHHAPQDTGKTSCTNRHGKDRPSATRPREDHSCFHVKPGIGKTDHEDRGCLHVPQDTGKTSCTSKHGKDRPSAARPLS